MGVRDMAGWFKKMMSSDEEKAQTEQRPTADKAVEQRSSTRNKTTRDYNEGRVRIVTMDSAHKNNRLSTSTPSDQSEEVHVKSTIPKLTNETTSQVAETESKWQPSSRESHFKAREIPSPVFGFQKRNMQQFYPSKPLTNESKPMPQAITAEETGERLVPPIEQVEAQLQPLPVEPPVEKIAEVEEIVSEAVLPIEEQPALTEPPTALDVLTITKDGRVKLPQSIKPKGEYFSNEEIQQIARVAAVEMTRQIRSKQRKGGQAQTELNNRLQFFGELLSKKK